MVTNSVVMEGISKSFANPVIANLSLEIKQGEIVAILGKNGTGKSTLLRILAGIDSFEGNLKLSGNVGYVGQNVHSQIFDWMKLRENVSFPNKSSQVVENILQQTKLSSLSEVYPKALSGGQTQLALIARALNQKSEILLLDEPFKALDYHKRRHVYKILEELHNTYKPTIVLISHDIEEAITIADRLLVFSKSPIQSFDTYDVSHIQSNDFEKIASYREEIANALDS